MVSDILPKRLGIRLHIRAVELFDNIAARVLRSDHPPGHRQDHSGAASTVPRRHGTTVLPYSGGDAGARRGTPALIFLSMRGTAGTWRRQRSRASAEEPPATSPLAFAGGRCARHNLGRGRLLAAGSGSAISAPSACPRGNRRSPWRASGGVCRDLIGVRPYTGCHPD